MLEQKIEELTKALNRVADALEKTEVYNGVEVVGPSEPKSETPETVTPQQPPVEDLDREAIKKELDELEVPYAARAKTETLARLLDEVKSKGVPPEFAQNGSAQTTLSPSVESESEQKPAAAVVTTPEGTVKPVHLKTRQDAMQAYVARFGIEKAQALLKSYNVNKLSELSDTDAQKLVNQINENVAQKG